MGSSLRSSMLFLFLSFISSAPVLSHSMQCHADDCSALLEFKKSFSIDSWNVVSNCCSSWEGIECDEHTGRVIALDLSGSFLSGPLHENSSIFRLLHLRSLDLSHNFFKYSHVPSALGNLTSLTYLDLSSSNFSGQIPREVSGLSDLTLLDFSSNDMLELHSPSLASLVANMTNLQFLHLASVKISSTVPLALANLSSLTSLALDDCDLHGEFPLGVLRGLPNLRTLSLTFNKRLTGNFPDDHQWNSALEELLLGGTGFSGNLPKSIGSLVSLYDLDLWSCYFSGSVPTSLGNLTRLVRLDLGHNYFEVKSPFFLSNLTELEVLSLQDSSFSGERLSWIGKLAKLTYLDLSGTNLQGEIPSSLGSLTRLAFLSLGYNNLSGEIPSSLADLNQLENLVLNNNMLVGSIPSHISKLTKLQCLYLSYNQLHGTIPNAIFQLTNLVDLDLSYNKLSGEVEAEKFLEMKNLACLQLSFNNLSLLVTKESESNVTIRKNLRKLNLGSCNLTSFPYFMRHQDELEIVDLSYNRIHGIIPSWIWNTSRDTLLHMDLSSNFLTGFGNVFVSFPWTRLVVLDLSSNMIQAPLPRPPLSIKLFQATNNSITGNISPSFCKLTSLEALDLSFNNLSGTIPPCFGDLGESMSALNLQSNNLEGVVPRRWTKGCRLKVINLSKNKLKGTLPASLVNCRILESINLSDNMINDSFPFWLVSLSKLKILILRSNHFYGTISTNATFQSLNIFDISRNNFTGMLPSTVLESLGGKNNSNPSKLSWYMHWTYSYEAVGMSFEFAVYYTMGMSNKATMTCYKKVSESIIAIDVSSNGFEGEVPESIGNIKNLYLLNLSSNALSGSIPPSLSNLTRLEAFDLSHNMLSGEIPNELGKLSFLEFFDVSHNHFVGRIPQGTQFDTFSSSWFEGNAGLCGSQLERKCRSDVPLLNLPSSTDNDEDEESFDILHVVVALGYASGLVTGVIYGNAMSARIQYWIPRTIGEKMITKRKRPTNSNSIRGTNTVSIHI